MKRVAPRPPLIAGKKRITHFFPPQLTDRLTPLAKVFETTSMGVPDVDAATWRLDVTGLVARPQSFSIGDLGRFPWREVESVFVCSGNPRKPTVPMRRAANVRWGGIALDDVLATVGPRDDATHVWAYGLDYGAYAGVRLEHFLKDMPMARLGQGGILVALEMNGAPLTPANGFPARLVIPGYYGTNCVKWLCRLEFSDRRADSLMTTTLYNDPDLAADPTGKTTKPVWEVAPESVFVAPAPKSTLPRQPIEAWGWAWSSCAVRTVEVSMDAGATWAEALLEPPAGHSWQRFSYTWSPPCAGRYELSCRATDIRGEIQPAAGARNAIYRVIVAVEG